MEISTKKIISLFLANKVVSVLFFLLSIFYVLNRHFIRPYIFKTINNDCILFVFGVLPNFVGVIIFLLLTTSILKMNLYYSLKLAFFYAIFIEAMYFFIDGIMYDFYDILSSLFAVGIMYVYYSFKNKKNV